MKEQGKDNNKVNLLFPECQQLAKSAYDSFTEENHENDVRDDHEVNDAVIDTCTHIQTAIIVGYRCLTHRTLRLRGYGKNNKSESKNKAFHNTTKLRRLFNRNKVKSSNTLPAPLKKHKARSAK